MKIKEFSSIRLHNDEHFQFYTSFRDLAVAAGISTLRIEALFVLFLSLYANELEALNIIRKNLISDDLADADKVRDSIFRGLSDAVRSNLNHFDPDIRASAKRLQVVLDTYGNLADKAYDAETGGITSLVNDFTGAYAADVATNGLTRWVTELDLKNRGFDDLKNNRYSAEATKTILRMKQERVKVDDVYRQIVERINALIIVEGEATYVGFVNELNKRIDAYNNTISIRRGKGKKGSDTAATDEK